MCLAQGGSCVQEAPNSPISDGKECLLNRWERVGSAWRGWGLGVREGAKEWGWGHVPWAWCGVCAACAHTHAGGPTQTRRVGCANPNAALRCAGLGGAVPAGGRWPRACPTRRHKCGVCVCNHTRRVPRRRDQKSNWRGPKSQMRRTKNSVGVRGGAQVRACVFVCDTTPGVVLVEFVVFLRKRGPRQAPAPPSKKQCGGSTKTRAATNGLPCSATHQSWMWENTRAACLLVFVCNPVVDASSLFSLAPSSAPLNARLDSGRSNGAGWWRRPPHPPVSAPRGCRAGARTCAGPITVPWHR